MDTKTFKMLGIFCIVALSGVLSSKADAAGLEVPHISVQGTAKQSLKPDQLVWRISIRNDGKESKAVAEKHNKSIAKVMALLKKQGVKAKDIQTTHMQLAENKQYRNNQWIKEGYFASSQIEFKLRNLKKYRQIWNKMASFSEVSMNGFSYSHSKSDEFKADLRSVALLDAKRKAKSMASVLGSRIGKPLVIEEVTVAPSFNRAEMVMMDAPRGRGQQNIAPGRIELNMQVKVVFSLE